MRLLQRSFLGLLLAVGVATCSESNQNPLESAPGKGQLSFAPRFSPEAAAVYAQRAQFAAVNFDHVRIVLVRPPSETAKDTTVEFNPSSPPKPVELTVQVRSVGERFNVSIDYLSTGVAMFHGQAPLPSHPPGAVPPQQPEIVLQYVGPGATATRVVVAPKTPNVIAPAGVNFTATAFDANNAAVPNVPIVWTSSDATVAAVNANTGVVTTTSKRGTATITASTPTNVHDDATLTVSLPPTGMSLVSGGGQTGKAGVALSQPAVVRVTAADGLGVGGVTVNFAPPAGGSVGSTSVTTDAQGLASTTLTLGSALGAQSFAATAAGFSVSIPATATAGDAAAIAVVSGSGQADTVRRQLASPFVVRVTDRFGNAVSGVTVAWARTAGSGTLGAATSVTNTDGQTSMSYTLGTTVGQETITASVAGVATPATFTAAALPAGPANIVIVSGDGQAARVGQALPLPLVVKVTDVSGTAIAGISVNWSATNGTIATPTTTDAQGQTSASLNVGPAVGTATAVASIGTGATAKSVTFTATAQPVFQLSFASTPPTTATSGLLLSPPISIALRDLAGAPVASRSITVTASAGTLGGATAVTTDQGGNALFRDLRITGNGAITLTFTTQGAAPLPTTITVGPGAPVAFKVTAANLFPKPGESDLITAQLVDAAGNAVPMSLTVSWDRTGGELRNQSPSTDTKGIATATFVAAAGVASSTVFVSVPGSNIFGSITLNPAPGLNQSLGSSADAARQQSRNELKRGLGGETRIGAETSQRRD